MGWYDALLAKVVRCNIDEKMRNGGIIVAFVPTFIKEHHDAIIASMTNHNAIMPEHWIAKLVLEELAKYETTEK